MLRYIAWVGGITMLLATLGCVSDAEPPSTGDERIVQLASVDFDQQLVIPSSVLEFRLRGTDRIVADDATVTFDGSHSAYGEFTESFSGELNRTEDDVGDVVVRLPLDHGLWAAAGVGASATFEGDVEVSLSDAIGETVRGRIEGLTLEFVPQLRPSIDSFDVGDVYPNQHIEVTGDGFLRASEGQTLAIIEQGHIDDGNDTRDLAGEQVALEWSGRRDRAQFPIDPAIFGVREASFWATIRIENQSEDGFVTEADSSLEINGDLQQSFIASLTPDAGSRGQRITIGGRGMVPNDDDAGFGMLLRYEGTFTPDDPELPTMDLQGASAPVRTPDEVVDEQTAIQSVWYTIEDDRTLSGLGAEPGLFEGTITPDVFDQYGSQEGVAWSGQFRVLPTKQVVYLKYLPAFSKALEAYGLRNVERAIRDRILEVARRDYDGINVEFRESAPDDFIDYAVIELGGPDPSGRNAFGYDNTFNDVAKDTGNYYLNDYLGGLNASSEQAFNNPYGGIFIESFSFFSPTLSSDNEYASPSFDLILGPFMPELGGEPVKGTEWPEGPRSAEIADAVHMVGSVIGNTVTHELGHSLGLTYFPADDVEPTNRFHNESTGVYIMDPGAERPFEERAEINGQGPARFKDRNREYLERIHPLPE
jgi:hypothetical protein